MKKLKKKCKFILKLEKQPGLKYYLRTNKIVVCIFKNYSALAKRSDVRSIYIYMFINLVRASLALFSSVKHRDFLSRDFR